MQFFQEQNQSSVHRLPHEPYTCIGLGYSAAIMRWSGGWSYLIITLRVICHSLYIPYVSTVLGSF
jgi:hypothetical protein